MKGISKSNMYEIRTSSPGPSCHIQVPPKGGLAVHREAPLQEPHPAGDAGGCILQLLYERLLCISFSIPFICIWNIFFYLDGHKNTNRLLNT